MLCFHVGSRMRRASHNDLTLHTGQNFSLNIREVAIRIPRASHKACLNMAGATYRR